jgi:hypothetical protein
VKNTTATFNINWETSKPQNGFEIVHIKTSMEKTKSQKKQKKKVAMDLSSTKLLKQEFLGSVTSLQPLTTKQQGSHSYPLSKMNCFS